MTEYIEREALLADIDAAMENEGMGYVVGQTLKRYVKRAPAADVAQVRHGRWLDVREKRLFGEHYFLCSNCKSRNGLMIPFNYCPNCGAKMDG